MSGTQTSFPPGTLGYSWSPFDKHSCPAQCKSLSMWSHALSTSISINYLCFGWSHTWRCSVLPPVYELRDHAWQCSMDHCRTRDGTGDRIRFDHVQGKHINLCSTSLALVLVLASLWRFSLHMNLKRSQDWVHGSRLADSKCGFLVPFEVGTTCSISQVTQELVKIISLGLSSDSDSVVQG